MSSLTVSSSLISAASTGGLTASMVTALWVIGNELDRMRVPADISDAVWVTIPSRQLRGENGRNDNVWLRQCLDRLLGLKINGDYRGDPWGAVVIAEWHLEQGGSLARILIPPRAIYAIRSPETFAKIEAHAAFKLTGPARRLYAALADKKRLRQKYWIFDLAEIRRILGVDGKKSYERWSNFRNYVLEPAVEQVNDFGTVIVTASPERLGRAVVAVRFDWDWKNLDEIRVTSEENDQPSGARHMDRKKDDAPPLTADDKFDRVNRFREWSRKNDGRGFSEYLDWKKSQETE